jgi:hypothetical protein
VRTAQEVDDYLVHGKGLRARWNSKRVFESLNNAKNKNKKLEKAFHKVEMASKQMSFVDHVQHLPSGKVGGIPPIGGLSVAQVPDDLEFVGVWYRGVRDVHHDSVAG